MVTATKPQGKKPSQKKPKELEFFMTTLARDLVTYTPKSKAVMIHSNVEGWGAIPVTGRENLRTLRDAMISICEAEKIK